MEAGGHARQTGPGWLHIPRPKVEDVSSGDGLGPSQLDSPGAGRFVGGSVEISLQLTGREKIRRTLGGRRGSSAFFFSQNMPRWSSVDL